ncbi:heme exporter protein CcmD, partial [Pseudoxanthomonas sp.]
MNYLPYVIAAYAVFGMVLAWDYVAPRLQVRQQLRAARLRAARRPSQTAQ